MRKRQTKLFARELANTPSEAKACSPSLENGYREKAEGARAAIRAFLERSSQHVLRSKSSFSDLDIRML